MTEDSVESCPIISSWKPSQHNSSQSVHKQIQNYLRLLFKSWFQTMYSTKDHWNSSTSSSSAAAVLEGAAPRRTSSAVPAALLRLDVPADRNGRGPSPSWCRKWWRSPASGTRWTLCLPSPQTPGSESRKECTVYLAPVLGPWWSGEKESVSVRHHVSRATVKPMVWVTYFIPIKGAVVIHDVHCTAVEKISKTSHFVWCYWVHCIYKTNHHPNIKRIPTKRAEFEMTLADAQNL